MCGITYIKKLDNTLASRAIKKRFENQIERGTQGFGFLELKEGKFIGVSRAEEKAEAMLYLGKSQADEILFHHRIPTSTPNMVESTHPIKVSHPDSKFEYYVVHNGIISNDVKLRENHLKLGYKYTTELTTIRKTILNEYVDTEWNDSEAVAIDFVESIEKNKPMEAVGSIAIIALQIDKKTRKEVALYFGRNEGNPLKMEMTKQFIGLSSCTGDSIPTDKLYRYDFKKSTFNFHDFKIGTYYDPYEKYNRADSWNNYDDTMPDREEEEFDMSDYETLDWYEDEIKKANNDNNWDYATELTIELAEFKEEIKEKARKKMRVIGF